MALLILINLFPTTGALGRCNSQPIKANGVCKPCPLWMAGGTTCPTIALATELGIRLVPWDGV